MGNCAWLPARSMVVPASIRICALGLPVAETPCAGSAAAVTLSTPLGAAMAASFMNTCWPVSVIEECSWVCAATAVVVSASSGNTSVILPGPSSSVPPREAAKAVPEPKKSSVSAACKMMDPLAATLVVADTRPSWLTMSPVSVTLPRGVETAPVNWLAAVPPPSTSTIKPRRFESVLACKYTLWPAARMTCPSGAFRLPAFETLGAASIRRP